MIYFDLLYLSFPSTLGYIVTRKAIHNADIIYVWYTI